VASVMEIINTRLFPGKKLVYSSFLKRWCHRIVINPLTTQGKLEESQWLTPSSKATFNLSLISLLFDK
jgi:hypothetical protein